MGETRPIIVYDDLDERQRVRYSEVVATGKPVDEQVSFILCGEDGGGEELPPSVPFG